MSFTVHNLTMVIDQNHLSKANIHFTLGLSLLQDLSSETDASHCFSIQLKV